MLHHNLARAITKRILHFMMHETDWNQGFFDPAGLRLGSVPFTWPQADATLFDDINQRAIGIEFKPPYETKRGCLTGFGQGLAYLNLFHASFLVVPEVTGDGFRIAEYISSIKNNRGLGHIPFGVVSYPSNINPNDPNIPLTLVSSLAGANISPHPLSTSVDSTFYVNWRDTTPHEVSLLLSTSEELPLTFPGDRLDEIWKKYWDEWYCPPGVLTTLDQLESNVHQFNSEVNGNPTRRKISMKKPKEALQKDVDSGTLSLVDALQKLSDKASPAVQDSNYHGLRKNHFNFMNQLGLWENGILTTNGAILLSKAKRYGWNSPAFLEALGYLILVPGGHLTLIYEFEQFLIDNARVNFTRAEDIRKEVLLKLDSEHLIKRNPSRSTTNLKKAFADEMTLWAHMGFVLKNGSNFLYPGRGFIFDWQKINKVLQNNFNY